jgi:hypothetical protein|tara:strand:+ start:312 stop:500 length:189 start_codon:yes stop_codon:yes gene_type:complete
MTSYDYATLVIELQAEIDRKIKEFEHKCYDLASSDEATFSARTRRLQLIAVRDLLDGKTRTL